jgi:competence protein ComGF
METIKFTKNKRQSISVDLNKFCIFAKEHDSLEITEWSNGEGYDIVIYKEKDMKFELTIGELDALLKTYHFLNNEIIGED